MTTGNFTAVTEFIIIGLTDNEALQIPLFLLFLCIYTTTLIGNAGIILLIRISSCLHTPMYFLLSNLSFVDLCYSSAITPNMVSNLLLDRKTISFPMCITQMCFFVCLVTVDTLMLAGMAFDRYSAVCNPLRYPVIMTRNVCVSIVVGIWVTGVLIGLCHTTGVVSLKFCGKNLISHFYCDIRPLLELSCSDTFINEVLMIVFSNIVGVGSLLVIFTSYAFIVSTILKIRSLEGKRKAFSTCSSHFICITIFYAPALFMYLRPSASSPLAQDKVASVFYTVVTPMLNPIIYSLRNKDVKGALTTCAKRECMVR